MLRPAADESTTRDLGSCWPKQARHTSQMDWLCMRGEELAVAAPARLSGRDGVNAVKRDGLTTTHHHRSGAWLLEGAALAGAAFESTY